MVPQTCLKYIAALPAFLWTDAGAGRFEKVGVNHRQEGLPQGKPGERAPGQDPHKKTPGVCNCRAARTTLCPFLSGATPCPWPGLRGMRFTARLEGLGLAPRRSGRPGERHDAGPLADIRERITAGPVRQLACCGLPGPHCDNPAGIKSRPGCVFSRDPPAPSRGHQRRPGGASASILTASSTPTGSDRLAPGSAGKSIKRGFSAGLGGKQRHS
jgi:hypothetical protein